MKKRSLFILLAALMVLLILPLMAQASWSGSGAGTESDPWLIGASNAADVKAWLSSDGTTITISGSGSMMDFSSPVDTPWNTVQKKITTVEINSGVASIGNRAFAYCINLTGITIPSSVASIGMYTFFECENLTSITIPSGVETISSLAFYYCENLTTVTVEAATPPAISSSSFADCPNLKLIRVPADSVDAYLSAWSDYQDYILIPGKIEISSPNGTVIAKVDGKEATRAFEGDIVTLTVTPDPGYELLEVWLKDKDSTMILNDYQFTMPASDVEITTVIVPVEPEQFTIIYSGTGVVFSDMAGDPAPTSAEAGVTVAFKVQLDPGYVGARIKSVTAVTDSGNSVALSNEGDIYTFTMPADHVTVTAETEPVEGPKDYKIIRGAKQVILSTAAEAVFASDADFSKFVDVLLDGKVLPKSGYTAKSGSTVITLKKDVIKGLKAGQHTLIIRSDDGEAATTFTIKVKDIPKTGDGANLWLWTLLLLTAAAGIVLTARKARDCR